MIQSGYCLIDVSWWNPQTFSQDTMYTDERSLKAYKDIKAALNSGKIVFLKLGSTAVRILTNAVEDSNKVRIQVFEPSNVGQDGTVTFSLVGFAFYNDGRFMWKTGGVN